MKAEPTLEELADEAAQIERAIAKWEQAADDLAPNRPKTWVTSSLGWHPWPIVIMLIAFAGIYYSATRHENDAEKRLATVKDEQSFLASQEKSLEIRGRRAEAKLKAKREQKKKEPVGKEASQDRKKKLHPDWKDVGFTEDVPPDSQPAFEWTLVGLAACRAGDETAAVTAFDMLQYLEAIPYGSIEKWMRATFSNSASQDSMPPPKRLRGLLAMGCRGQKFDLAMHVLRRQRIPY